MIVNNDELTQLRQNVSFEVYFLLSSQSLPAFQQVDPLLQPLGGYITGSNSAKQRGSAGLEDGVAASALWNEALMIRAIGRRLGKALELISGVVLMIGITGISSAR